MLGYEVAPEEPSTSSSKGQHQGLCSTANRHQAWVACRLNMAHATVKLASQNRLDLALHCIYCKLKENSKHEVRIKWHPPIPTLQS